MGEFSIMHIVLFLLVIVFFFGGRKLPELGSSLGKGIREFKKAMSGKDDDPQLPSSSSQDRTKQAQKTEDKETKS